MATIDRIEEKATGAIESLGRIVEKLPNMKDAMKLLENKETEIRLKFESLTLDGDIALSITLLKEEKPK
jgi:hypothetical protein